MRRPDRSQRKLIIGRTGSGKTVRALEDLSCTGTLDEFPWIAFDWKGDDLLSAVAVTAPLALADRLPEDPGLYVVKVGKRERASASDMLERIFDRGRTGVLVDEVAEFGHHSEGLKACLRMGRSKEIPMIMISQRPVYIDTYAWSESEFKESFYLDLARDQQSVEENFPKKAVDFDALREAGKYHSYYWDVLDGTCIMRPPGADFAEVYSRLLAALPVYRQQEILGLPRRVRL